jgi:hypothetical protein
MSSASSPEQKLMPLVDGQLKANISSILRSDKAMKKVNFKFGKFTIGTMHYLSVAALLDMGRIHCKVDASQIPEGAAAVYDGSSNTIVAKDSSLYYNDDKASVVHEATHAYMDMLGAVQKNFKVKNLDNETCAYLAGAIYTLALGQQPSSSGVKMTINSSTRDIQNAAMEAVKKKGLGTGDTNAGRPIDFSSKDVAGIQAAIKSNKLYKDWNTDHTMNGM